MPDDSALREQMIKNTVEQLEELEKGIVLASLDLEKMQGMPDVNLAVSAQIRLRRTQLEEEYELMRARLEELRGGNIPSENKAQERLKKARHSLREANKAADELASKQKSAHDDIYEDDN
jgi:hypothetical protein